MKVTPKEVARHYDEWTPYYLAAFGDSIQAHRPANDQEFLGYLMDRIGLTPNLRALDAGCGICGPARFFAARSGAVIDALTVSPLQAQLATEVNQAAGLMSQITVKLGDFHELANLYGPSSFDRVYFLESLSHAADPARVLQSVYTVLKPGGYLYIKDFFVLPCQSASEQREVLDIVSRVNQAFKVETPWAEELTAHLTDAGFERIFVEHPQFVPDISKWQAFEEAHTFGLYGGKEAVNWVEWLELKYRKPADPL